MRVLPRGDTWTYQFITASQRYFFWFSQSVNKIYNILFFVLQANAEAAAAQQAADGDTLTTSGL